MKFPQLITPTTRLRDLLRQIEGGDMRRSDQRAVVSDLIKLHEWLSAPTYRVRYGNYEPPEVLGEFDTREEAESSLTRGSMEVVEEIEGRGVRELPRSWDDARGPVT